MKDVDVPAKNILLLDKHANYIEAFEKDKDDLVECSVSPPRSLPYMYAI